MCGWSRRAATRCYEDEISAEEWPKWREADGEEWKKVEKTQEESIEVQRQLKEIGAVSRSALKNRAGMEASRTTRSASKSQKQMVCKGWQRSRFAARSFRSYRNDGSLCDCNGASSEFGLRNVCG